MRPFTATIPLEEAQQRLRDAARPLARVETVALDQLVGRVLAEDMTARADVPPFARAMMDGYAVREPSMLSVSDLQNSQVSNMAIGPVPPLASYVPFSFDYITDQNNIDLLFSLSVPLALARDTFN